MLRYCPERSRNGTSMSRISPKWRASKPARTPGKGERTGERNPAATRGGMTRARSAPVMRLVPTVIRDGPGQAFFQAGPGTPAHESMDLGDVGEEISRLQGRALGAEGCVFPAAAP